MEKNIELLYRYKFLNNERNGDLIRYEYLFDYLVNNCPDFIKYLNDYFKCGQHEIDNKALMSDINFTAKPFHHMINELLFKKDKSK